jgi:hypothetical protein
MIEFYNLHDTIYSNILHRYGNTKLLDFILRVYRFIFCKVLRIQRKKL